MDRYQLVNLSFLNLRQVAQSSDGRQQCCLPEHPSRWPLERGAQGAEATQTKRWALCFSLSPLSSPMTSCPTQSSLRPGPSALQLVRCLTPCRPLQTSANDWLKVLQGVAQKGQTPSGKFLSPRPAKRTQCCRSGRHPRRPPGPAFSVEVFWGSHLPDVLDAHFSLSLQTPPCG